MSRIGVAEDARGREKNSLSANRLRNHSVTGKQVDLNKLGKVPTASHADSATSAGHATSADSATSAGHATSADTATSAGEAATVGHNAVVKIAVNVPTPASGSTVTTLFTLDGQWNSRPVQRHSR